MWHWPLTFRHTRGAWGGNTSTRFEVQFWTEQCTNLTGAVLANPERGGGNGWVMLADRGGEHRIVDYWQTCTCNPSDAIAYTSAKISAWWTSFGGYRGRLLNRGGRPGPPLEPPLESERDGTDGQRIAPLPNAPRSGGPWPIIISGIQQMKMLY